MFSGDRDAYLSLDDTFGNLQGTLYIDAPQAMYNIDGGCERTADSTVVNVWLTLVPGGTPYYGSIYLAYDGEVYIEAEQVNTGVKFVMRRQ